MAGDVTLGDFIRVASNNAVAYIHTGGTINNAVIGGTTPAAITGTAIQGTTVKATTGLIAPVETTATTSTAANLAMGGVSKFGSTVATTFTMTPPTIAGIKKELHCVTATTAANVTVNAGMSLEAVGSTQTQLVFSGAASITMIAETTAVWGLYGAYNSTLIALSS